MRRLIHDSVWLAAEARQLSVDDAVNWQWLDGLKTSRRTISLFAVYVAFIHGVPKKLSQQLVTVGCTIWIFVKILLTFQR